MHYERLLHLIERKLTFKPTTDDHGGLANIPHKRVQFGEEFGLQLDGALVNNGSHSIVLFTHGNRHNITKFREHYQLFTTLGQSFFTFDYPGYGRSPGIPSESSVYASARAAYAYISKTLGYQPDKIVSYGCSMGGAVAIELTRHTPVACLITESTFTNTWDMAKHLYPFFPAWPLLPKRFENDAKLPNIQVPILLIHGEKDPTVPVSMASELFAIAQSRAKLVLIPEADHINSITVGAEKLRVTIQEFISTHTS